MNSLFWSVIRWWVAKVCRTQFFFLFINCCVFVIGLFFSLFRSWLKIVPALPMLLCYLAVKCTALFVLTNSIRFYLSLIFSVLQVPESNGTKQDFIFVSSTCINVRVDFYVILFFYNLCSLFHVYVNDLVRYLLFGNPFCLWIFVAVVTPLCK